VRGKIKNFHPAFKILKFVIYSLIYIFTDRIFLLKNTIGHNVTGDLIGYTAAVCTTIAYIPQVIKVIKTKKTNDISTAMFILISGGVLLWLIYGIILVSIPMIIANGVTFILSFYIFIMKIKLDHFKTE
jgi:MtN3 and saliva related transmembrane protein